MPVDISHAGAIAQVMKQCCYRYAIDIEDGSIGMLGLACGSQTQCYLIGLPCMIGQASDIVVVTVAVIGEEAVLLHKIDYCLHIVALGFAKSANDGLLYIKIHVCTGFYVPDYARKSREISRLLR